MKGWLIASSSLVRATAGLVTWLATMLPAVLVTRPARAQVNVETLRKDLREAPAVASLEGSFTGRTGNVEAVVAGAAATGAARFGLSRLYLSTSADYTRFAHVTRVSKSFLHLRYNYALRSWLFAEVFAQQQHDKFQRLLFRELAGTGPRFLIAD